jgi:hypothetical protein
MGLFQKKADPISDRARALNAEIAALESKIQKLNQQISTNHGPRVRSTTYPHGPTISANSQSAADTTSPEPVFEDINDGRLNPASEPVVTPRHFNEMGVRKYDLVALIDRVKKYFNGPPAANPKLVSYLASGSVQGLRPLRYEKRVARNRFIVFASILALLLLGIFTWLVKHH